MGFINAVLDEHVDYGFEGGPEYNNEITDLENGFEHIESAWQFPRHRYSANFGNIKDKDRDYIVSVFHACRGRRHAFKFKDWNDYIAENEPIAVEAGTLNPVQLYKTYRFGQAFTVRPIQALLEATIFSPGENPVAGDLDLNTGIFTPSEPWGTGQYTWDGEFYVWVRFDNDYNSLTINSWQANSARVDLYEKKIEFLPTNVPTGWEE